MSERLTLAGLNERISEVRAEAREGVQSVAKDQNKHEEICSIRYAAIQKTLGDLVSEVKGLTTLRDRGSGVWKALTVLAAVVGAVVGWYIAVNK